MHSLGPVLSLPLTPPWTLIWLPIASNSKTFVSKSPHWLLGFLSKADSRPSQLLSIVLLQRPPEPVSPAPLGPVLLWSLSCTSLLSLKVALSQGPLVCFPAPFHLGLNHSQALEQSRSHPRKLWLWSQPDCKWLLFLRPRRRETSAMQEGPCYSAQPFPVNSTITPSRGREGETYLQRHNIQQSHVPGSNQQGQWIRAEGTRLADQRLGMSAPL